MGAADLLLLWMSARGSGSWSQFKAAVEELNLSSMDRDSDQDEAGDSIDYAALPAYQLLRLNLQRLGHAEFFGQSGVLRWRVPPPCLAIAPQAEGHMAVLTGARSTQLLERIALLAGANVRALSQDGCPTTHIVAGGDVDELSALGTAAGVRVQPNAPLSLLTALPRVDDPAVALRTSWPIGTDWEIKRFDASALAWVDADRVDTEDAKFDLFRFQHRFRREFFISRDGDCFRIPGQVGKYSTLGRRRIRVLEYDRSQLVLAMPAALRPPFMVERALVLCSGRMPEYSYPGAKGPILHYSEIPTDVANLAASLLCQVIR